jgi:hypothetical protein
MTVSDHGIEPRARGDKGDLPTLRASLAWITTVGLGVAAALGIGAILGASLDATAIKIAGSGGVCGFYGLFAISSSTLYQRSSASQLPGLIGVLSATIAVAFSLAAIWGGSPLGDTATRVLSIASLVAAATGFAGFLLTQQRDEDPAAIRGLMLGTVTIVCVLAGVLIIDIAFATGSVSTNSTAASSSTGALFSGISFVRFVGIGALLALLGTVLLPVVRRAHPAYRGGRPDKSA